MIISLCFGNTKMILMKYLLLFTKQIINKGAEEQKLSCCENNSLMPNICPLAMCV